MRKKAGISLAEDPPEPLTLGAVPEPKHSRWAELIDALLFVLPIIASLLAIAAQQMARTSLPIAIPLVVFGTTCWAAGYTCLRDKIARSAKDARHRWRNSLETRASLPDKLLRTGEFELDQYLAELQRALRNTNNAISVLRDEVHALNDRYEMLTTNIAASIVIRHPNGRLVFCSPYTQVLTGYNLEEIYDSEQDLFAAIAVDEDRDRYSRAVQVSELGEDTMVRYRVQHKSGLKLWFETRIVPICDHSGAVVSTMSVTNDVTDSLNYQRQIEQHNRDLSDFTYMVSHDLKAPIFTIKGMAAALSEDVEHKLDASEKQLLGYITDAASRLEGLVTSIIEYSALSTKPVESVDVDVGQTVTVVIADQAEQIRSAGAIVEVATDLPQVHADPVRIYQVFANLIGNAVKYRASARTVRIKVDGDVSPDNMATITVSDNGLGIAKDKLDTIFRPYHRAHSGSVEGNGIGLACVKKIVEQLGGTVSVRSVEGVGSEFQVRLPVPPPAPQMVPRELAHCFD